MTFTDDETFDLTTCKDGTPPGMVLKGHRYAASVAAHRAKAAKGLHARSAVSESRRRKYGSLPPVSLAPISFGRPPK